MPYATAPEKYSLLTEEYIFSQMTRFMIAMYVSVWRYSIYSKLAFFGPEVK